MAEAMPSKPMATCRTCKSETRRLRTIYHQNKSTGKIAAETDECPNCKPGSFEPRWMHERGAIAPEVYPNQFRKRYLRDGRVGYFSTDERRADLEAKLLQPSQDEQERLRRAVEQKRANRRTVAMTPAELETAVARARARLKKMSAHDEKE